MLLLLRGWCVVHLLLLLLLMLLVLLMGIMTRSVTLRHTRHDE